MEKLLFKIFIILIFFTLSLIASSVLAREITITNPLKYETFDELVKGIAEFLLKIATPLAALMIVIAGFYFVTSSGNPRQVETAKSIILYTLVGYGIILLSWGLIQIIKNILGVRGP